LHVADDYSQAEITEVIRNGRVPPLEKVNGPMPPLYMPSWKHLLSDEDVHQIVAFLWSKQQKSKESW